MTSINAGSAGLRKPTQIKVNTSTTNTSSNFAAANGINGHGISGSKIQNKFGPDVTSKDKETKDNTPSLMGKFGRKDDLQDKK